MDADIRPMWTTPIWIGQVDPTALPPIAQLADGDPGTHLDLNSGHTATIDDLQHTVTDAFALDPSRHRWRHRLTVWQPGFYRGMTYSHATVRVLVIIASNSPTEHPDSGVLNLHDPRIGAANVALPGLPWGRTSRIPPVSGGAIAVPGWIGCSIAPLRAHHRMAVWTAEALDTES